MKDNTSKVQKSYENKAQEYFRVYIEKRSNAPAYFIGVFLYMLGITFLLFKAFTPREIIAPDIKILFVSIVISLAVILVIFFVARLLKWSLSNTFYIFYFCLFNIIIMTKQMGDIAINWDYLICITLLAFGGAIVRGNMFKCFAEKLAEIEHNKELSTAL